MPPLGHRSVLLHEAIDGLALAQSDVVVDATLGGAGHTREIARRLGPDGSLFSFDADRDAIERAQGEFQADARIHLIQANFRTLKEALAEHGVTSIDKALFDLGWSGYQLTGGRGFSFLADEPLGMMYDADQALTAESIVNGWSESSLADVIFGWGEERYARRIARQIVEAREKSPIRTSLELAEIARRAYPPAARRGKLHPATKTFQALRIAVNDELGALNDGLEAAWSLLKPGGRIAVITFHSIEDRAVKRRFAGLVENGAAVLVHRRPVAPSDAEISENPRARSAKLRVIQKL